MTHSQESTIDNTSNQHLHDIDQVNDERYHKEVIELTTWTLEEIDAHRNEIRTADLFSQLAIAYGYHGQFTEAFTLLDIIFQNASHVPRGYICESKLYSMQGFITRAVDSINKGLDKIPNDPALQHEASLLLSQQKNLQQQRDKVEYYDSIIENTTWILDKDSPSMTNKIAMRLYKLRALAYGNNRQFVKAFKDVGTLFKLYSDKPDAYLCSAQLYLIQGLKRRALDTLDQGLKQFPNDPCIEHEAAVLLEQQRRIDIIATAPLEIVECIIGYLNPVKHVLSPSPSLLNVSKTWRYKILNCATLWSDVNTSDYNFSDNDESLRSMKLFCDVLPLVNCYINKFITRAGPNIEHYLVFVNQVKEGNFTNLQSLTVASERWDVWNEKQSSNNSMIRVLRHIGPQLTKLDVMKPPSRNNSSLQHILLILFLCPKLKTLCVEETSATWIHEDTEEDSINNGNASTPLTIADMQQQQQRTSVSIDGISSLVKNITVLDRLYLVCRGLENHALESILKLCPHLKFFELHGHSNDHGEITRILQRYCRKLHHFGLNTAINDNDRRLGHFASYFHSSPKQHKVAENGYQDVVEFDGPQLQCLYSNHYMNRLPTQISLLSAYSNTLKNVKLIMDKDPFHRMDIDPSITVQQLTFPMLRKLSIFVRRGTYQVVASLLQRCSALEHVILDLDQTDKSQGILSSMTARYLPRLEHLEITANKNREDIYRELALILESHHHHRVLNNSITSTTTAAAPQSLLRKISLSCFNIPSTSNVLTLLSSLPKLESIILSDLTISKTMMDGFANSLIVDGSSSSSTTTTRLKHLSLIRLQDVLTDDTIGILCSIPTLESLELQRLFRISDKCLDHFVKAAPRLKRLVVQRCPLISEDTINQAKESGIERVYFSPMLLRRRAGGSTLLP